MRHLLGIADLSPYEITTLLDRADALADGATPADLAGRLQANLFFENSTRTALSFSLAARRTGAHAITLEAGTSSLSKGETLLDTARTVQALGADVLVIRHRETGAAARVASQVDAAVVNAGDGTGEHPTQALLDALALRRRFGRLDGLRVTILGDLKHSRVAHSNMLLLAGAGAKVTAAGPPALTPDALPEAVKRATSADAAMDGADAVMCLRVQRERLDEALDIAPAEYHAAWGLTAARFALAPPHTVAMHPGPINRGFEIADEVADNPERSLILEQVRLGVPTRMAVLERVLGA